MDDESVDDDRDELRSGWGGESRQEWWGWRNESGSCNNKTRTTLILLLIPQLLRELHWLSHFGSAFNIVCALLTQPCCWFTRRSTLGDRAFPVASARALNSLPSSVRNAPSRAEDWTFLVVVWQWFGDRAYTAQYNCCLPATTHCRRFCPFCFLFSFNFVQCPCNVFDLTVSL